MATPGLKFGFCAAWLTSKMLDNPPNQCSTDRAEYQNGSVGFGDDRIGEAEQHAAY